MMAFRILGGQNKTESRITTLYFRRADFGLFSGSAYKNSMGYCHGDRVVKES